MAQTDEDTLIQPGNWVGGHCALPSRTLLLHTYEVERLLAAGGMGAVYLVRHLELGTRHAIKIIKPELTGTQAAADVLELFRREAATLSGIRHDAVVGYEGFFRDENRTCYLVMEFVDGPSLAQVLTERSLSVDEVYRLRDRLAGGLAVAHARGVTHRDLAPDNVILPQGQVEQAKLIDFGIAKLADTMATTIIGTAFAGKLRYAAPEQLGLFGGKVSPVSDIYSLGLVLAAAAGTPLSMGDSLGTAVLARREVPDLAQVPAALQPQLRAMLQPDPAKRPADAAELLRRWPHQRQVQPNLPTPGRKTARVRRRPYPMLLLLAAVGLAATAGWLVYQAVDRPLGRTTEPGSPSAALTGEQQTGQAAQPSLPPPMVPPQEWPNAAVAPAAGPAPPPADAKPRSDDRLAPPPLGSPQFAQPPVIEPQPAVPTPGAGHESVRSEQPAAPVSAQPAPAAQPTAQDQPPAQVPVRPAAVAPLAPVAKQSAPTAPPVIKPAPVQRSTVGKPPLAAKPRSVVKQAPKAVAATPRTAGQPRRGGGSRPARCGDVLSKLQLGEPVSAADRAVLKECR